MKKAQQKNSEIRIKYKNKTWENVYKLDICLILLKADNDV